MIAFAIGILGGLIGLVVRFKNPELTETQLFLRYWWFWLGLSAAILAPFLVGWAALA